MKIDKLDKRTYRDSSVVCGRQVFGDAEADALLNPTLIVEVLSPSIEAYDRGAKFEHDRRPGSLREYVLIAQDRVHIQPYTRCADL